MAITTTHVIDFFGTQGTITDGSTSTIANAAFSVAADITSWTNADDAKRASVSMTWQYASGTLTAGGYIGIFGRLMNVDGTSDNDIPSATNRHTLLGILPINSSLATSTNTTITTEIPLPNTYTSQVYDFYFENRTGVTIAASWLAKITALASGPHA